MAKCGSLRNLCIVESDANVFPAATTSATTRCKTCGQPLPVTSDRVTRAQAIKDTAAAASASKSATTGSSKRKRSQFTQSLRKKTAIADAVGPEVQASGQRTTRTAKKAGLTAPLE